MKKPETNCRCGQGDWQWMNGCGAWVCTACERHYGLVRCFCGWADDGGDGRAQLEELGETIDPE